MSLQPIRPLTHSPLARELPPVQLRGNDAQPNNSIAEVNNIRQSDMMLSKALVHMMHRQKEASHHARMHSNFLFEKLQSNESSTDSRYCPEYT
jgi:hypothetical protein